MKKLDHTFVQFRVFKKEVIAVFPYHIESHNNVSSYAHIGQHSACIWNINQYSKPATSEQYRTLLAELKDIGYSNLKVLKRRNHREYLKSRTEYLSFLA